MDRANKTQYLISNERLLTSSGGICPYNYKALEFPEILLRRVIDGAFKDRQ